MTQPKQIAGKGGRPKRQFSDKIGWRTLKQLYKILKRQNKICKKNNVKTKIVVELPI